MLNLILGGLSVVLLAAGGMFLARRVTVLRRKNTLLQKMSNKLEADLVDRRAIERELAHMASFANIAPNPIIEINPDGSIGYMNPAAELVFPTLTSLGSKHPLMDGVLAAAALLTNEHKTLTTRPIKIDERVYDQQISLVEGGPRVCLYLSDITELKRLDQLKNDFVNIVSHELRTPLTTIAASIKMITHGMLGEMNKDQAVALRLVQDNIDRLARLINDLLDISKIEAGKLELHLAWVDLAALAKEVSLSFEPLARERNLQIRTQLVRDSIEVMIDRDKIHQVFANLINNALKFTQEGTLEISVEERGKEVHCFVSDTGRGMAPADLPKLFGKFQQFGPAARGREKGSGLGLSICKGFIELHGGRIWAENRPAKGLQVTFVLPQRSPVEIFDQEVRRLFSEAVAAGKPLTLLRLAIPNGGTSRGNEKKEDAILRGILWRDFIQAEVRGESDPVFDKEGVVWVALPHTDDANASEIVKRIQTTWSKSVMVEKNGFPRDVSIEKATYPHDGNLVEELLTKLTR